MEYSKLKSALTSWMPRWLSLELIVIIGFLGFMAFISDYSYVKSVGYEERINDLKAEIKLNEDSAAYYEHKANELSTDQESLEKIAREQYGMKSDNEDVFITDYQ